MISMLRICSGTNKMPKLARLLAAFCLVTWPQLASAAHPLAAENITSLTNGAVKYSLAQDHHVILQRGSVTAVVVDNQSLDIPECPGHRAGYNGLAVLRRDGVSGNLFVPTVAGLNFEHIHDGSVDSVRQEKFEPRQAPMQIRVVDAFTVELHQPPTPNMRLESCGRYHILDDGVIEYTFECIPRADTCRNGYLALFWASYIQQPESTNIHFLGKPASGSGDARWIEAASPAHGVDSTHPPAGELPVLRHDLEFPLTLVFNRSPHVYVEPWYYGVSHGRRVRANVSAAGQNLVCPVAKRRWQGQSRLGLSVVCSRSQSRRGLWIHDAGGAIADHRSRSHP